MRTRPRAYAAAALGTLALSAGGPVLVAGPAQAGSPHFLDRHEYARLHHGMTAKRVTRIADISGVVGLEGGGYQTRRYRGWRTADGSRATVLIVFRLAGGDRWRLDVKSVQP